MEFQVNHPILFVLAGFLVAVVLGQSVYFLVKALRRSRELGMDQTKIRKTIKTAAVFTIAPAVSIVISVTMIGLSAFGVISALAGSILHNLGAFVVLLNSSRILRGQQKY